MQEHPERALRAASAADGDACAAIYAPYVRDTAISFELVPPSAAEMSERIAAALADHAWLVLEEGGCVCGYAYGGPMHRRAAYRWSCEVSVYVDPDRRGAGSGRALYTELFARLAARGYLQAIAGMTLPNAASAGLHRAMGFQSVGVYRRIGFKLGSWHDVEWLQRELGDSAPRGEPPEPR
jgi:phosphinothricin acetyltransferase